MHRTATSHACTARGAATLAAIAKKPRRLGARYRRHGGPRNASGLRWPLILRGLVC